MFVSQPFFNNQDAAWLEINPSCLLGIFYIPNSPLTSDTFWPVLTYHKAYQVLPGKENVIEKSASERFKLPFP